MPNELICGNCASFRHADEDAESRCGITFHAKCEHSPACKQWVPEEQPVDTDGNPICADDCNNCVYEQKYSERWRARYISDVERWHELHFCPACGARLNSDGTSGPSAEETAEWMNDLYREHLLWQDYEPPMHYRREMSDYAIRDLLPRIASHLGIDLEENDADE